MSKVSCSRRRFLFCWIAAVNWSTFHSRLASVVNAFPSSPSRHQKLQSLSETLRMVGVGRVIKESIGAVRLKIGFFAHFYWRHFVRTGGFELRMNCVMHLAGWRPVNPGPPWNRNALRVSCMHLVWYRPVIIKRSTKDYQELQCVNSIIFASEGNLVIGQPN